VIARLAALRARARVRPELFYEKTFLQRAAIHIYFSDACLVCARICGARLRDAASYFPDARFTDYKALSRNAMLYRFALPSAYKRVDPR